MSTEKRVKSVGIKSSNLGFPRIGAQRELKKVLEDYWAGKVSEKDLFTISSELKTRHWNLQNELGITFIPSNDFSLYDQVLDTMILFSVIPERYKGIQDDLKRYFALARGLQDSKNNIDVQALPMKKWFDTNYHYIVPEFNSKQSFKLNPAKILNELKEARSIGIETRPVLIGPLTFLLLAKFSNDVNEAISTLDFLDEILKCYEELFILLEKEKVEWIQLDEPCLVLDLEDKQLEAYQHAFEKISSWKQRPRVMVATYFDILGKNISLIKNSKLDAVHIDLIRGPNQLDEVLSTLPSNMIVSLGVIDGRNIWRSDLDSAHQLVNRAIKAFGNERVWVGPSCSLLHSPVDLDIEKNLDPEIKNWMAFAKQKLNEISIVSLHATELKPNDPVFEDSRKAVNARKTSQLIHHNEVKNRVKGITHNMFSRESSFLIRREKQKDFFPQILFPTTTIGSFPQTPKIRKARADWRSGKISQSEYDEFLKAEVTSCIKKQEELELDILVHGEFERTDMVEYFGEKLDGFAFTSNGWVQSYGSRCVKPPVIYGDISRPKPMTVDWAKYAQSLTTKPMKGMLTGPVTILQWSFVRNDQPRSTTCKQIALALLDEIKDLESAGIKMIQVDEAAIREGLPLRQSDRKEYLKWAVDSFKLATSGVKDDTQIHTHMCYSEFSDILDSVAAMDADVISIETSRSKMKLLGDFEKFQYPNEIGPGVYDIHSPRVPSVAEIIELLEYAAKVIPVERLWVNPDCGLKTRGWPEVELALRHMTIAVKELRKKYNKINNNSNSNNKVSKN